MKILCATDFSPRARAAGQVAVDLARLTSGSIELLHVVAPPPADVIALAADAGLFQEEVRQNAEVRLATEARALAAAGPPVTARIDVGDVEITIHERARAIGADLVVMGANGRSAIGRLVLGSGADRTVRRAERPVLIVPEGVESLTKAGNGVHRLQVTVALDGRSASGGALDFVRALRKHVACDVTVLRLYWPIEEYARLGLAGPRDLFAGDPEVEADLQRSLAQQVGVLPGAGKVTFAIEAVWGDPAWAVLERARGHEANLVVMGAESRRGLARLAHPAVSNRVARQAAGVPIVFAPPSPLGPASVEVPGIFTVLAPTDLSPAGNRAVPYAYDRPQGKLDAEGRRRLEAELRALVPRDAEARGITTHVTVIDGGEAATAIRQGAERLAADAIVLGTHGRGGARRALIGSVSADVMRHAGRPVFIVPTPKEEVS